MRVLRNVMLGVGLGVLALAVGCGGGGESQRGASEGTAAQTERAAESSTPAEEPGEVDRELAERGESLFEAKGCNACHRIGGGRLVGPDLAGVTERRSRDFILGMILNPDSMLANDPTAKQLLGEYFTPMSNQRVTRDEALALFEYLRSGEDEE